MQWLQEKKARYKYIRTKNGLTYLKKDDASQTIIIQNNKDLHIFGIAAQI